MHDSISKKAKQDEAGYAVDASKVDTIYFFSFPPILPTSVLITYHYLQKRGADDDDGTAKRPKRGAKKDDTPAPADPAAATPAPAAAAAATPAPAAAAPVADEEKKVKVVRKGRAPVDPNARLPQATHHVLEEGNTVWDCMMNQTNIGNNNNKFYVIQVSAFVCCVVCVCVLVCAYLMNALASS